MLGRCEGGPANSRAVRCTPPLDIRVDGGVEVLVNDAHPERWRYVFIAEASRAAAVGAALGSSVPSAATQLDVGTIRESSHGVRVAGCHGQ